MSAPTPRRFGTSGFALGVVLLATLALAAGPARRGPPGAEAATDRALLIGIQSYTALGDGWWDLDGPLNDVALVQAVLVDQLGFPPEQVRTLRDTEATRRAILDALARLVRETGRGDRVYVHYSGHGSRVDDANGDEGARRKDSTLVPVDGGTAGDFQILDDEIHIWLARLLEKTPNVVFVVDACHSGTITRNGASLNVRGVTWTDPRSYGWSDTLGASLREIAAAPREDARRLSASACADDEEAHEVAGPDGKIYGLLTWAWCRALVDAGPDDTFGDVFRAAQGKVHRVMGRSQDPQIEGQGGVFVYPDGSDGPKHSGSSPLLAALRTPALETLDRPWSVSVWTAGDAGPWKDPLTAALADQESIRPLAGPGHPDVILAVEGPASSARCRVLDSSENPWGNGRVRLPLLSLPLEQPEDTRFVLRTLRRLHENDALMRLADDYQDSLPQIEARVEGLFPVGPEDSGEGIRCFADPPSMTRCDRCRRVRPLVLGTSGEESAPLPAGAELTFTIRNPLDRTVYAYLVNLAPDGSLGTYRHRGRSAFRIPARDVLAFPGAAYALQDGDVGLVDTYFCLLSPAEWADWELEEPALGTKLNEPTRSAASDAPPPILEDLLRRAREPLRGDSGGFPILAVRRYSILVVGP